MDDKSQQAAGIASLLKTILMFERNTIPPQVGMPHRINPNLERYLQKSKITIPTTPRDFKLEGEVDEPRRILINNFDAAGGNSCLLLEDYRGPSLAQGQLLDREAELVPCEWSSHAIVTTAKTPSALRNYKRNLLKWLLEHPDTGLQNVAYTTNARRKHFPLRSAYVASTTQDLIAQLESDVSSDDDTSKPSAATTTKPVVFMFTGQGAHYGGMGSQLYHTSRTFRQKVDHCAHICAEHGFPAFSEIITDHHVDLSTKEPVQIQLAVVTLEVALAAVWTSDAGLKPTMVMGHSLGEYVALYVAGVLSLADMLYLVGHRALLLARLCEAESYSMLAVSVPTGTQGMQACLETRKDDASSCSVACTNSPRSMVLAGPLDEIQVLQAELTETMGARTKLLPIPYAFHSGQMDPLMKPYKALAGGITFSTAKVPVISTLLASVCESSTVFDADYLWRQTREECRFFDAVSAARAGLEDHEPIWLEIGPTQVLGSFVSATYPQPPGPRSVMSTLGAGKDDWTSLSTCLARLTEAGIDINWRRLYAPHARSLRLLRLPTYAWDLQDFWITHTEAKQGGVGGSSPSDQAPHRPISTCAQSVLERKSARDEIEVSLQASTAEPGLHAVIRGHRVRGVAICPGTVFVEAAVAATNYLLESNSKSESSKRKAITIRNLMLNRPLRLDSTNSSSDGEQLITKATSKTRFDGNVSISFRSARHALGGCTVTVCDGEKIRAGWGKMSHFIRARMNEVIRSATDGGGHKMQASVFYALFSNTVQYDAAFKCAKMVYVSEDFQEAVAEIVLQPDPADTTFFSSPYVGESLVHLAGFVLNANPDRPRAAETTFIMSQVESLEQPDPSALVAGKKYLTFVHVSRRDGDEAECDVYVFGPEAGQLVMQCSGLRFHETANGALDQVLGKSTVPVSHNLPPPNSTPFERTQSQTLGSWGPDLSTALDPAEGVSSTRTVDQGTEKNSEVFEAILESIVTQTGTDISELKDNMLVGDLGVDSIMAIEITSDVRRSGGAGSEFPATFLTDYPTIGDLRRAFGRPEDVHNRPSSEQHLPPLSERDEPVAAMDSSGASSDCQGPTFTPVSDLGEMIPTQMEVPHVEEDNRPEVAPLKMSVEPAVQKQEAQVVDLGSYTARTMLLHGNPRSGHTPLYLLADGTGSIATYLHLGPLPSNAPVYGIDSPFGRDPDKVTLAGITGTASIIVAALVKARPEGPFHIGGFSGGGMLAYEVARQLGDAGRQVDGLLIIDMACPRHDIDRSLVRVTAEAGLDMFQKMAAGDAYWSLTPSSLPMRHLLAFFKAVEAYHPLPMAASQRPRKCVVIWAEKGLIGRCAENVALRQELEGMDCVVEAYPGFMQDSTLGAIAWGVPDKRGCEGALGPNGWDAYVGGEILCKSVEADHLDMLMPGQVHLLQEAMEEAVAYFQ